MKSWLIASAAVLGLLAGPARAADTVKLGVINTMTGALGVFGKHVKDGADLALDSLGHKLGGLPEEISYADDEAKPDVGRQLAEKMIAQQKVDFIIGPTLSNVLTAIYPLVVDSPAIMFGGQGGPSQIAGPDCSAHFFSVGIETQTMGEAMGQEMTNEHYNGVYTMTPNYVGGKDVMSGFKRYFKGKITGEVYTPLDQSDFQTELSQVRADNPPGVFIFYPGGLAIQFVKQYAQSGLRGKIPLYSIAINETIIPALGDTAEGNFDAANWAPSLDTPRNKEFVAAFRKKYAYQPSEYAAVSYDTVFLIDSAVKAVNGKIEDKPAVIAALAKADFPSVRGSFKFNTNHFPIQNWYLTQITKADDASYYRKVVKLIFPDHKDSFYPDCKMQ